MQSLMVAAYEAHSTMEAIAAKESSDKARNRTQAPPGSRAARNTPTDE